MTDFGNKELLGSAVIEEKLNLGRIAKFDKLKNTKFLKKKFLLVFQRLLLIQAIICHLSQK